MKKCRLINICNLLYHSTVQLETLCILKWRNIIWPSRVAPYLMLETCNGRRPVFVVRGFRDSWGISSSKIKVSGGISFDWFRSFQLQLTPLLIVIWFSIWISAEETAEITKSGEEKPEIPRSAMESAEEWTGHKVCRGINWNHTVNCGVSWRVSWRIGIGSRNPLITRQPLNKQAVGVLPLVRCCRGKAVTVQPMFLWWSALEVRLSQYSQ